MLIINIDVMINVLLQCQACLSEAINALPDTKKVIAINIKLLENLARASDKMFFRTIEDFENKCKDDEA